MKTYNCENFENDKCLCHKEGDCVWVQLTEIDNLITKLLNGLTVKENDKIEQIIKTKLKEVIDKK